jgi:hypothetical protein
MVAAVQFPFLSLGTGVLPSSQRAAANRKTRIAPAIK